MNLNNNILVNNLSLKYGKTQAIQNISFQINKGEIVGFLGPNGAGKSTTLKILAGIQNADSGTVIIDNTSIAENNVYSKKHIGFMQENNPLPEELRVSEYLKLRAELKNVPKNLLFNEVKRVMDLCDLFRTARKKIIRTLSKGFKQRVGIADSLINNPKIIILDEPTIGLDPHQIQGIRKLINNLKGNHTVIISSHILSEIEKSCDKIIILNQGILVADGNKEELKNEFINFIKLKVIFKAKAKSLAEFCNENKIQHEILHNSIKSNGETIFIIKINKSSLSLIENFTNLNKTNISKIDIIETDLEDVFLAATKRSWEDKTLK